MIDPRLSDQDSDGSTERLSPPTPAPESLPAIPGYEVKREVCRAGQGVVYQAIQRSTKREVAIKTLRTDRPLPAHVRTKLEADFQAEIHLLAKLKHPNIVSLYDAGRTSDGRPFFAMEYVSGRRLAEYVHEEKLPILQTLDLFHTVCAAVGYVHKRGVIHFDLKPSNILVDREGIVKVLDFGLAKPIVTPGEPMLSDDGKPFGTFAYMSPEQTRGQSTAMHIQTDVYSLGVVLYELLTGVCPHPLGMDLDENFRQIRETPPKAPSEAWKAGSGVVGGSAPGTSSKACPIDRVLDEIVLKALAKKSESRYADATEFADALGRYLRDEPPDPEDVWSVLRHGVRRGVQRHVFVTLSILVIAVGYGVHVVGGAALLRWPSYAESFLMGVDALLPEPDLTHVRVIALRDETDVEALARSAQLENVSADNVTSFRRLHGHLMKRLSDSNCRAVVWDIGFQSESEFDQDFANGVRSLNLRGIDVVATVAHWWLDRAETRELSPAIRSSGVRPGCSCAQLTGENPWGVLLVAQRGAGDALPSLSLAGYAAARHPRHQAKFVFDPDNMSVQLLYTAPEGIRLPIPDRIQLTDTWSPAEVNRLAPPVFSDRPDLHDGEDAVGNLQLKLPSDAQLATATTDYETAFRADSGELRRLFADKVAILSDLRSGVDSHPAPDDRMLSGVYAHATAIDGLLKQTSIHGTSAKRDIALAWTGALLGCMAAVVFSRSVFRVSALAGLTLVLVIISILACWQLQVLLDPLIPAFALWMSGLASPAILRVWRARRVYPSCEET